jgi:hypothetical protein
MGSIGGEHRLLTAGYKVYGSGACDHLASSPSGTRERKFIIVIPNRPFIELRSPLFPTWFSQQQPVLRAGFTVDLYITMSGDTAFCQ